MKLTPEQTLVLQQLAAADQLTPDNVVTEARKKKSPLHGLIDWNVDEAATRWWTQQARHIIASARIQLRVHKRVVECVAYVRDPRKPAGQQGYVDVGTTLMSDQDAAIAALDYEAGRAGSYLARVRALAVALDLEDRVDKIIVSVSSLREYLVTMKEIA